MLCTGEALASLLGALGAGSTPPCVGLVTLGNGEEGRGEVGENTCAVIPPESLGDAREMLPKLHCCVVGKCLPAPWVL